MQIANALNNNIRILFNPAVENFKLFDFLIVKSQDYRYLAQIIEIYDDKFDSSQNVAKLKLFYKISKDDEVMPYDSFTPNKECEIVKINSVDVQNFINQDKETFVFSKNAKDSESINIQFDFFNNNPLILADKIENANITTTAIIKELSEKKNSVVIDSTGIIEIANAKKIIAGKNFKIPLNPLTIEYIFEKCLSDSTLEFQAIGTEILNEIKKFALTQQNGCIPFGAFIKVLADQYKATPYSELRLLLSRIKKFQMDEIFARSKKDYECFNKYIEKNKIVIVDLSNIRLNWQKAYLEYIFNEIKQDVYLSVRINDESFDLDLINTIYNKKKNISLIPNVSYSYKKLPSILQYCKNYILMPSLYQRMDFLDANFALSNLVSDEYVIFGKNTDNFLYLSKNLESKNEQTRNYRKIALSMANKQKEEIETKKIEDELSNFNQEQIEKNNIAQKEQIEPKEIIQEEISSTADTIEKPPVEPQIESEIEPQIESVVESQAETQTESQAEPEIEPEEPEAELEQVSNFDSNIIEKTHNQIEIEIEEELPQTIEEIPPTPIEEIDLSKIEESEEIEPQNDEIVLPDKNINETLQSEPPIEDESIELSDDELDFYNDSEVNDSEKIEDNQVVVDDIEYKIQSDDKIDEDLELEQELEQEQEEELEEEPKEEIDLMEVASKSIDNHFEDVLNGEMTKTNDEDINLDIDKSIEKENLPIFTETVEVEPEDQIYNEGDVISHSKYGRGVVIKTIQYEQRQLLQIDFEKSGKKLLDPKVANITLE